MVRVLRGAIAGALITVGFVIWGAIDLHRTLCTIHPKEI